MSGRAICVFTGAIEDYIYECTDFADISGARKYSPLMEELSCAHLPREGIVANLPSLPRIYLDKIEENK